ncbi:hypothetical protein scyTo_0005034 [Scyliorhinus torazame]|uniref:Uncharacterized protein n=1 Tax=Scyliorhinus torazame TaxID=75743 RepID=A0A401P0V8_SCYTO|nr:hypothetical protein [Scyliorhinus torazame]
MSASGALFPSLVAGSRGSSSKYLVEFRAGKMSLNGSTVTPDKRKGQVYIQQTDDSLIHFCWKDRTAGTVEDDLIIFPDDCEFKRVAQCTTGRVFVLKFKTGSKRLFFWMQEPKSDKDEEFCRKVNEYLNNPPMPGALGGSGSSGGHELAALGGESGLQSLLGNMSHNQLMQLMGATGLGGLASGSATSPTQPIQLRDLQSILASMTVPATAEGTGQQAVDLSSVLTPEIMAPILANSEVQERLLPYLPTGESLPQPAEEIQNTLTSPQFQQAMSMFSAALASGQLGPLMSQFGLPAEAVEAAGKGDVEGFAKAMQHNSASSKTKHDDKEGDSESKDKKDEEEDMSLD